MSESRKTDPAKIELQRLRQIDAAAAMAEYHAAKAADLENMAQLRALRLAKEAANRKADPAVSKAKPVSKRR
jgi:hypothetical protein